MRTIRLATLSDKFSRRRALVEHRLLGWGPSEGRCYNGGQRVAGVRLQRRRTQEIRDLMGFIPCRSDLDEAHQHVGRCYDLVGRVWSIIKAFAWMGPEQPPEATEQGVREFQDKFSELCTVCFGDYAIPDSVQGAFCRVGKQARLGGVVGPNAHVCLSILAQSTVTQIGAMLPAFLQAKTATGDALRRIAHERVPVPQTELDALWSDARREYLLAVDGLAEAGTTHLMQDEGEQAGCKPEKRPSDKAFRAWWIRELLGISNQADIAERMVQMDTPATQGQVSKWLREVDAYLAAGGILPKAEELAKPETDTVDPKVIDMGARQDHLTPRQRPRRDPDADSDRE